MVDDPPRRSPVYGVPIMPTPGRGVPKLPSIIEKSGPRASTQSERDRIKRLTKIPPEHVRAALGHGREELEKDFGSEHPTPVTMIIAVRAELKCDIEELKDNDKVADARLDSMNESLIKLNSSVEASNKFGDKMLEMVREELQSKRSIDEKVKLGDAEITRHREFSKADAEMMQKQAMISDTSFVIQEKWKNVAKVIGWVTAGGGLIALLGLIFKECA